jgi:zinc protease
MTQRPTEADAMTNPSTTTTPSTTATVPRPPVAAPGVWTFPEAARGRLGNGLEVVSYDVPGQYVISVRLAVPMPLVREPRGREGIGTIMARTLDEGTARHTAEEFAELLERKGIALGAGASESGLSVDMDVAKGHLPAALQLMSEAVREPAFPENEVARHVRTRLAEIDHERAVPGQRAALAFLETYFDEAERASRPSAGTRESVGAITREELVAFHAAQVVPSGSTVVVAGDLTGVDVLEEVERALGAWTGEPLATTEPVAPRRAGDAARIVFVDRPGSVQTEIYLGCPGPDRRVDGGWAPYPVLAFVMGGSPNARIDAVLREEKGYTYGMRASFRPRRREGLFLVSGSVRADATAEALDLLLDILERGRDGFSAQETRSGVDFIHKTAPGRYATADAVADEAAAMALEGLSTEFTTANLLDLATVDADRLAAAYNRFVTGDWTVVVVGDADRYADSVRGLGRGEVTVVPA